MPLLIILLLLSVAPGANGADTPYALIFKTGSLSDLASGSVLRYAQSIELAEPKEADQWRQGEVELAIVPEQTARLRFFVGDKQGFIGDFPASVGNPLAMYFIETVIRDMVSHTGGSPFYIRNRLKEALGRPGQVQQREIIFNQETLAVQEIVLRPFADDAMRDKMGAYADLALRIVVSERIPGWYYALEAMVEDMEETGETPYRAALELMETD